MTPQESPIAILARKFGLCRDGAALVCGMARITLINGSDELAVSVVSDHDTAKALSRCPGRLLYANRSTGALSLAIDQRKLADMLEILQPTDEPMPSYGRFRS